MILFLLSPQHSEDPYQGSVMICTELHYPSNPALHHVTQRATALGVDLNQPLQISETLIFLFPTFYFKNKIMESLNNQF